jgi:hypothetical protein
MNLRRCNAHSFRISHRLQQVIYQLLGFRGERVIYGGCNLSNDGRTELGDW